MTFRAVLLVLALGVDTTGAFHTPLTAGSGRAGRAGTSVKSTKDGLESAGVAATDTLSLLDEQKEKALTQVFGGTFSADFPAPIALAAPAVAPSSPSAPHEGEGEAPTSALAQFCREATRALKAEYDAEKGQATKDYTQLKQLKSKMEAMPALLEEAVNLGAELAVAEGMEDYDKCAELQAQLQGLAMTVTAAAVPRTADQALPQASEATSSTTVAPAASDHMTESAKSAWFTAPGTGFTTPKPTSTQVPEFAFDGESSIGGGQTAMASSIAEEQTAKATKTVAPRVDEPMVSAPMIAIPLSASRGQFAFNGHSSIGGGQTATGARTGKPPTLRSRRERGFAFNGHSSIGGGQTAVAAKSVAPPTLRTRRAQEQFKFDGHSSVGHRLQGQAAVATKPVMMTATAAGESSPDEPPSAMRPFNRRDLADDFTFDGKSNVGNDETKPPRQQAGTPAKRTAPRKTPTERIAARKTPAERITARKLPREGTQDYRVKHGRALLQGFTFDGKSGIGSEETKSPEQAGPRTSPRKTASAVTPEERIARGRALLQSVSDERFSAFLAPHLAAFTRDEIDEAELAQRKAEAREEAKEAESEDAGRKASLDECEALLGVVGDADAHASSLSQQLAEATLASEKAAEVLEAALGQVAPAERIANRKTFSVGTPAERIARGRALLQGMVDERFAGLLAPHLAAFTQDKIDEAELAQRKAEARAEANEVESELAGRKAELDECEALLGLMGEVQASELELSQQLEEAWTARGEAMGELEAALNEAGL